MREIFAADFRDRIIHHVIMMRLEPLFESVFIEDAYNCRKNKGTLYGIRRLKEHIAQCSNNYTEDCWIGKFDMLRFFISIHKPTLFKMLRLFILENYKKDDIDLLLYLVQKVVLNKPLRMCIRKSQPSLWKRLDKRKSLFTCGDDYGLPIGNLTSLIFANFYLTEFDKTMSNKFTHYGRYVDDFFIVSKNKKEILDFIPYIKTHLYNNLQIALHPDKIYFLHYTKGVNFIGGVIKKDRTYIANRTVSNIYNAIRVANNKVCSDNACRFYCSMNSYFGFMKHHLTYALRYKISNLINTLWKNYISISKKISKFSLNPQLDKLNVAKTILTNKINIITIF